MKSNRLNYFIIILLVMILGILSRKVTIIPLFIGDVLYAVLTYFGFRFLIIKSEKSTSLLFSLLFCFGIEFLQLVQIEWLIAIRKTTLGHYILGQGFLWLDLLCYVIGTLLAFLIDWKFIKTQNSNS
ncbi:ribosomal maturation YjgA family protein [Flavobacterium sp.]|uniref:ribosomal maturation YjgA family protein n=1 Tax=Flavobacterium sp. TaxID=239 RepID=UPI002FDEB50B